MRTPEEIAKDIVARLFYYRVEEDGDAIVYIGKSPEDRIECRRPANAPDVIRSAEQWVDSDRRSAEPVIVEGIEQALTEFKATGMPPTTVSEERLGEIRRKNTARREQQRTFPGVRESPTSQLLSVVEEERGDLLSHIDVLEARIRDMAQDDVGEAWKAGYKEAAETAREALRPVLLALATFGRKSAAVAEQQILDLLRKFFPEREEG